MPISASLIRALHRLHRQLSELKDRAERGPKQIRARDANLARLQEELAKVQAEAKAARVRADQKQLLLKSSEEKIVGLEGKLNACQSNREYQALKEQIAADRKACEVLADEILDSLERVDEYHNLIAEAQKNLAGARDELAKVQEVVRGESEVLGAEIGRIEAELAEQQANLSDDVREVYDRITRSKGHDAMAEVQGNFCGGCHQQVTPNLMSELAMDRSVFCKNCGRLIYLPEDRAPGKRP